MKKILKNLFELLVREFWKRQLTVHQRNDSEIELNSRLNNPLCLERFGYKVYSQSDEDGIIEEIFNRIGLQTKTFIEFGVGDGIENNSHYLLHKAWSGLWIEGSKKDLKKLRKLFVTPIENNRLTIVNGFITKDNINELIEKEGKIKGEIDLLSIDIDGNDYWIWEAIRCVSPRVVVIEYNAKFPPNHEWVMAYDPKHQWSGSDKQGASLKSLEILGKKLGYQLAGTNISGINAFFVKENLARDLFFKPAVAEKLYNPARWTMQYISGHPSREYIGK